MKKCNLFLLAILCFAFVFNVNAQSHNKIAKYEKKKTERNEFFTIPNEIERTTLKYINVNGKDLFMDVYKSKDKLDQVQPVVIYVFGGAFRGGQRYDEYARYLMSHLAMKGITGVSIDYRLGFRGRLVSDLDKEEAIDQIKNLAHDPKIVDFAFDIAVEDVYMATKYLINNAEKLKINPNSIILSGSSAGACTALRAEYFLKNDNPLALKILPKDFTYKGILAFAGAIHKHGKEPEYKRAPAPTLFIAGDQDMVVRYRGLIFDNEGFYATKHLVNLYKKHPEYNFKSIIIKKGGHEDGCNKSVVRNIDDIYNFINDYIFEGKKGQEQTILKKYMDKNNPFKDEIIGDEDNNFVSRGFNAIEKN